MAEFIAVSRVDEFTPGTMKEFMVRGLPVLVARVGNEFYAVQGKCSHTGGVLARGKLEGTIVTCPKHGSRFDVRDGSVVRWTTGEGLVYFVAKTLKSPRPLKTYAIQVINGDIMVSTA
jgi:3-phenylpropionate/trans-cinnamate dioxygenase ferredoxin subunit